MLALDNTIFYFSGSQCGKFGTVNNCEDCPEVFNNASCSGDCEWRMQPKKQCVPKSMLPFDYILDVFKNMISKKQF